MIHWICFEWKTDDVPTNPPAIHPLVVRAAEPADEAGVRKAVTSSFSLDPAWGDVSRKIVTHSERAIDAAFEHAAPSCVVLLHGHRIIGASVLDVSPSSENHLVTGPCTMLEYRSRGVGGALLLASLQFLKGRDVSAVRGITRDHSIAARFVYPKFGGKPVEGSFDPINPKKSE